MIATASFYYNSTITLLISILSQKDSTSAGDAWACQGMNEEQNHHLLQELLILHAHIAYF